jgi:thiol:disulfide interchange protein
MIGFSLVGGLILNLMPCVLPVIGLKVLSFVEQAGQSRARVLTLNLWYSLGLLSVFAMLATAAVSLNLGWGQQFQSTGFNIVMSGIVFAMALSFLGVWEIPLPGFVGTGKANDLQQKEGAGGAFFKGVLTTVLATPCSGPFLGPVFGFTLQQPPVVTYIVFLCIGLGMASPYLLIGAFPRLIKFLPKPGVWMDTFKQMLAFVLLGTVVFMFTFLKRDYVVPTFGMLVAIWAGCWWIGRTPLYEGARKLTFAWGQGLAAAAIAGYVSFALLGPAERVLPWQPYSPERLTQLTASGKTVMVDFTAEWCLTCKLNLKNSIDVQDVKQVVEANGVVPLLADWTDESEEIKRALEGLGSNSIPVLAIFPAGKPTEPIIMRDLISSRAAVIDALKQAGPSRASAGTNTASATITSKSVN